MSFWNLIVIIDNEAEDHESSAFANFQSILDFIETITGKRVSLHTRLRELLDDWWLYVHDGMIH